MDKILLIRCYLALRVLANLCKGLHFTLAYKIAVELINDIKKELEYEEDKTTQNKADEA